MPVYFHGSGSVLPTEADALARSQSVEKSHFFMANDLNYDEWIDQKLLRRMSRILKMGLSSAQMALKNAGIEVPDAIITGTGYGCQEDTGVFIKKMIENHENALNPTPFIQSTHNTIGSLVALITQCRGYNQTYSQSGLSFENALLDALMLSHEKGDCNILVGGIDEMTPLTAEIMKRFGSMRNQDLSLWSGNGHSTALGEGSAFFVLNAEKRVETQIALHDVTTLMSATPETFVAELLLFLSNNEMRIENIDCVVAGDCGIPKYDQCLTHAISSCFSKKTLARFKHVSGEHPTAVAFAVKLSIEILERAFVPEIYLQSKGKKTISNVLIMNQHFGMNHSLILLKR